jgi:hypothetical protein
LAQPAYLKQRALPGLGPTRSLATSGPICGRLPQRGIASTSPGLPRHGSQTIAFTSDLNLTGGIHQIAGLCSANNGVVGSFDSKKHARSKMFGAWLRGLLSTRPTEVRIMRLKLYRCRGSPLSSYFSHNKGSIGYSLASLYFLMFDQLYADRKYHCCRRPSDFS